MSSINELTEPKSKKAKYIYDRLPDDLQNVMKDEYIIPELRGDNLIKEFDRLIESQDCQSLRWQVLTDVVEKIINHKGALSQMCELNTLGFKSSYQQHFIQKKNTFVLFNCPLSSMCAEFVMRKWH
jgi:hypothetical protein